MGTVIKILFIGILTFNLIDSAKVIKPKTPRPPTIRPLTTPHRTITIRTTPKPTIGPTQHFFIVGRPGYRYNRYRDDTRTRLQCYTCKGDDCFKNNNDSSTTHSFHSLNKVTCQKNEFCSTIRREILVIETINSNDSNASNQTNSSITEIIAGNTSNVQGNVSITSSTPEPLKENTSVDIPSPAPSVEVNATSESSSKSKRSTRQVTRVIIERGCKSYDFIQGALLTSSGSSGNQTDKVYAQLCTKDFCNKGDGRLRCYECNGTGSNHACMTNASSIAKKVMCQPDKACFVERKSVSTFSKSTNSTVRNVMVSRGCRAASSSDDTNKITNTNGTLRFSCRLDDFCNSVNANLLVRSNSATGHDATIASVILTSLVTLLLQL